MCQTLRRYGLTRCTGDCYSAEWVSRSFEEHGIKYEHCSTTEWKTGAAVKNKVLKSKSVLYRELLPRLNAGEIELLDNPLMISQFASLQRRSRVGGGDTIDHPPGRHDDASNAVAVACDCVFNRQMTAGAGFTATQEYILPGDPRSPNTQRESAYDLAKYDFEMERQEREEEYRLFSRPNDDQEPWRSNARHRANVSPLDSSSSTHVRRTKMTTEMTETTTDVDAWIENLTDAQLDRLTIRLRRRTNEKIRETAALAALKSRARASPDSSRTGSGLHPATRPNRQCI